MKKPRFFDRVKISVSLICVILILPSIGIKAAFSAAVSSDGQASDGESSISIRFAVIGDYGTGRTAAGDVADLVISWSPDFVITLGDNNYPDGAASTIDKNIGQFYHSFIDPYTGIYGVGADTNRFFPSLGNHDWHTPGAEPYLDYFTLPGNERYYDFVWGPVHFFAVDSCTEEPDGASSTSTQANWLKDGLAASTEPWKLVYFHHAPYSSGPYGEISRMQWPFQQWGATAVLAAHDHVYERLLINGFPYFVNGLGGGSIYKFHKKPHPGSQVRYNSDFGAMLVQADASSIDFKFYSRTGLLIDEYLIVPDMLQAPSNLAASAVSPSQINLAWTDNSNNEDGFRIERATASSGPWSQIATVGVDAASYSDTSLSPSTTYYYRVCAYNADGDSGYSNTASASPSGINTFHVDSIEMSWTKKSQHYTAYATVTVVDQNGAPVKGASVYGTWSGAWNGDVKGVTRATGSIKLRSGRVRNGGTFTFTVTDIVKTGWTYDASKNVATSGTVTCP